MKIKKILAPIDFSENSLNALRYAASFAKSSGAAIFILHVSDPDSLVNDLKGNLSPEHLLELLKAESFLQGIKLSTILKKGVVSDLILTESHKNDIDLVVMGTQGAGNITREYFGTNTTKVISKTECAVLAVPSEAIFSPVRKAILSVDLEHRADKLIEDIINTMKVQQTAVLLAYIGKDPSGKFERELKNLTEDMKVKSGYDKILSKLIHSDHFLESLETFAHDIEADMLVMITHHRGLFDSIFDPSKTKAYAFHTNIPLMAIPQNKTPVFFLG